MARSSSRSSGLISFRRAVSWHRRKLAVLAAVVAVVAGVNAATPAPPPSVAVLVLTHDVAGGTRLSAGDVEVGRWPSELAPDGVLVDPDAVVGRTIVAPMTRGSALTRTSVLTARATSGRTGSAVVAVRLADPTLVRLLRVGDRVDVLAARTTDPTGSAVVVAAGALLVTVPAPPATSGPIGSSGSTTDSTVILVEVDLGVALRLTQAATTGPMTVVLR